jgi:hypothetical protein
MPAEHAALWNSSFHSLGGLKRSHLPTLLQFWLGAHDLGVMSGRWEQHYGQPRSPCLPERCSQHCVEDEYHMVFECDAYESIRDWHRPLGTDLTYKWSRCHHACMAGMMVSAPILSSTD